MTHDDDDLPDRDREGPFADEIAGLLGSYLDRMNVGERLTEELILSEYPDLAAALIRELRTLDALDRSAPADQPLGTLGDYTLRRQIGRGGMGVVYDAWENSMDRRVALKVLPAGFTADTKATARFLREAQAAGKLHHQNIVGVYSTGVREGTPWYSMEYVEGETLAQIMARLRAAEGKEEELSGILQSVSQILGKHTRTNFSADDEKDHDTKAASATRGKNTNLAYYYNVAEAFAGVADGLQHAHSKGIIHRDIKPSNLILDREGRLRILDFGLAHLEGQESLTVSGDLVGTVQYMSPEQAQARKIPIDHRTDVYSLGATLYELVTWRPPFKGKDHQDTLSQVISHDPPAMRKLNPRMPRDIETVVLKCLRKDPGDRYGTAEALGQDLRRFVRGDRIEAKPQSTLERVARRVKRNLRTLGMGTVFVILLAVTLLLVHQYRLNRRKDRAEQERRARAVYQETIGRAVADIPLGSMHLHASSGGKNRLDPWGSFGMFRFQDLASESPLEPLDRAVAAIASVQPFPPGESEGYYHLARAYTIRGDLDAALRALTSLFAVDDGFAPAHDLAAHIHRARGEEGQATLEAQQAEQEATSSWERAWFEARRAEEDRAWQKAAGAYSRLLDEIGNGTEPYQGIGLETRLSRGQCLLWTRDYEGALNDFVIAHHAWPQAIEPCIFLGQT